MNLVDNYFKDPGFWLFILLVIACLSAFYVVARFENQYQCYPSTEKTICVQRVEK